MLTFTHKLKNSIYDYYAETLEGIGELLRIIKEKERNSEQERSASRDAFSRVVILLSSLLVEIIFNECVATFMNNSKETISKETLKKIEEDKKRKKGIEHRMKKWPFLLTRKNFDFASEPFQSFEKLRDYRNAIAHNEFNNYNLMTENLDTNKGVEAAVNSAIEVSKTIEKHFFPCKSDFSYQGWVEMFNIPIKCDVTFQQFYNKALKHRENL